MKLTAKVIELGKCIEEEVVLDIGGVLLTCFICLCPYRIEEGKIYTIELSFVFLDDTIIKEIHDEKYEVQQIGDSFKYKLTGKVENRSLVLSEVLQIRDELIDETYLEEKFIELNVDRISVDFI